MDPGTLEVDNLSLGYRDKPITKHLSFHVEPGEILCVLGPSGVGKTTLLRGLAGLQPPDLGTIRFRDTEIRKPHPDIGILLQNEGLIPWRTVAGNIGLGPGIRRLYGPDGKHCPADWQRNRTRDARIVEDLLERFELSSIRNQYPGQLSGGQKRRTAIARTLADDPVLLLMDEPMAFLDQHLAILVKEVIREAVGEKGRMGVVVTHSVESVLELGSRVLIMAPGNGSAQTRILDSPERADIEEFFAGSKR